MQDNIIQTFMSLFSFTSLFAIFSVVAGVWVFLVLTHWCIDALVAVYPKYRIQLAQTYPMIRIVVWLSTLVYIVVGIIKPPQAVLFASLGSMGLAIGLAAQDVIRNLLAGIVMAFSPRFRVGDMVQIGEHYGEVIGLDLSITRLKTFDDNTVAVPNADILKMPISNANSGKLSELVVIPLLLPANISIQHVKAVAIAATRCSPFVYLKQGIRATINSKFQNGFYIELNIKAYVIDVRLEKAMATDVSERILEALHEKNLLANSDFDLKKNETQAYANG